MPEGPAAKPAEPEPFSLRDAGIELAVVGVAFSMSPSVALYMPLSKSRKSAGKVTSSEEYITNDRGT